MFKPIRKNKIAAPEFIIEINCENDSWHSLIPDADDIVRQSCIKAIEASGITKHTCSIEISVLLTDDNFIQNLNSRYREKDKPTNVLSFPLEELVAGEYEDVGRYVMLGDIILSLETINAEAEEQKKSIKDHLTHLTIHGALHLLGYDHIDNTDAEVMEGLEAAIMKDIGIPNPYE